VIYAVTHDSVTDTHRVFGVWTKISLQSNMPRN